jgi:hypothetical protein
MKKVVLMGSVTVAALLAGCVERRVVYVPQPAPASPSTVVAAPPPQVEVAPETPPPGEIPPPLQTEVVTVAPGAEYVWMPGVWVWRGRWIWGPGHWVIGPHPHAVWFPGRWERHGRRSVWVGGYWR